MDRTTTELTAFLRDATTRVPGRWVFTTSFGLEDQVVTHALVAAELPVDIVTLDTERLFPETRALWAETERRYGLTVAAFGPAPPRSDADTRPEAIYESKAARLACCDRRKVEPLGRALAGAAGWIAGLRGGRGGTAAVDPLVWDEERALWKAAPLALWSREEAERYCREHDVPVSPLHARGYPSIGCEPCTRAIRPGEDERAGRWWWEDGATRECGLHVAADGRLVRAGAGR
ncbi:phosphoadenylyl-sulfate reductase [uncultured Sphingomonas sp.]|uniref:phosphoadenylyl-sulfate reductase n=1 Tax=uncultured Sphingomonas sp. TaxID=158754 RepID=UPI0035C9AC7B